MTLKSTHIKASEVAAVLAVTCETVRNWGDPDYEARPDGFPRARRLNRRLVFDRESFERWYRQVREETDDA